MKRGINFILFLALFIFLIINVSALDQSLKTQKLNDCVNLIQNCPNCTYVNVSFITVQPNSNLITINQQMQKRGTFYNYTFCNTTEIGDYFVNGVHDLDGITGNFIYDFKVTPGGYVLETADSILYTWIILGSFLLFIFTFTLALKIPLMNHRDEKGYIVGINVWKYAKIFSIWFTHGIFIFFMTIILGIVNNFATLSITINLVTVIYRLFYILFYPMTIIILSLFVIFIYKDILYNKEIIKYGKAIANK